MNTSARLVRSLMHLRGYKKTTLTSTNFKHCEKQLFPSKKLLIWSRHYATLCKKDYENISDITLDTLSEYFENVADMDTVSDQFDVNYEGGVLTINVSDSVGTYVINKQAPNKQIWLSSPISGPKRYDYNENSWKYVHDGKCLHQLLEEEFSKHLNLAVNLQDLPYYCTTKK